MQRYMSGLCAESRDSCLHTSQDSLLQSKDLDWVKHHTVLNIWGLQIFPGPQCPFMGPQEMAFSP